VTLGGAQKRINTDKCARHDTLGLALLTGALLVIRSMGVWPSGVGCPACPYRLPRSSSNHPSFAADHL